MRKILCLALASTLIISLPACKKVETLPQLTVPVDMLAPSVEETEPVEILPTESPNKEEIIYAEEEPEDMSYLDKFIRDELAAPQYPVDSENSNEIDTWTKLIQQKKGNIIPDAYEAYNYGLPTFIVKTLADGTSYVGLISNSVSDISEDIPVDTSMIYGVMIEPDGTKYTHTRMLYQNNPISDEWYLSNSNSAGVSVPVVLGQYLDNFIAVENVYTADNKDYVDIFCFDSPNLSSEKPLEDLKKENAHLLVKITLVADAKTHQVHQAYLANYDTIFKRFEYTNSFDYTKNINIDKPTNPQENSEDIDSMILGILMLTVYDSIYAQTRYYTIREMSALETDQRSVPDGTYEFSMNVTTAGEYRKVSLALYGEDENYSYDTYNTDLPDYMDDYDESISVKLTFDGPLIESWSLVETATGKDLGHPTEEELRSQYRPKEKYVWQDGELVLTNPKPKQDGLYNFYVSEDRIRLSNVTYWLHYDYDRGENELLESFAEYNSQIYLQITFNEQEIQLYEVVLRDTLTNLGQISPQEVDYYLHPEKYATQVKAGTFPDYIFLSDYSVNTVHAFSCGDRRYTDVINDSEYNLIKIVSWTETQEPRIEYISNVGLVTKQNAQRGFVDFDLNRVDIGFWSSSDTPPNETIYMYITPIEVEDYIKGLEIRDYTCKKLSDCTEEEIIRPRRYDCIYNNTSNSYTVYSEEHSETVDIKPGQIFIGNTFSIYDIKIRKTS